MLGIMAGMDQETWFAGFDVVPRAVLLLISQVPDARHHGRLGPQDSVEFHRCSSWTKFFSFPVVVLRVSWSRQCFTQWRFRSCSSSRSSLLLSRCVPFHCRQARVARRHALLGPFPGSEVLGQVVLARRCATPGAVSVRAVRSVARGDTTGAVLGRGLGHYDRCRGLDSLDRRLLIVALRQFPVVLV